MGIVFKKLRVFFLLFAVRNGKLFRVIIKTTKNLETICYRFYALISDVTFSLFCLKFTCSEKKEYSTGFKQHTHLRCNVCIQLLRKVNVRHKKHVLFKFSSIIVTICVQLYKARHANASNCTLENINGQAVYMTVLYSSSTIADKTNRDICLQCITSKVIKCSKQLARYFSTEAVSLCTEFLRLFFLCYILFFVSFVSEFPTDGRLFFSFEI